MGTLGYQVHTNRELGMMLRGEKPLAVFNDREGFFHPVLLRYLQMFDRYVHKQKLIKREHRTPIEVRGKRQVSLTIPYALPQEFWRIDEMIKLRDSLHEWTDEHERKEGTLLGYTEEQNAIWIASRRRQR
jgi:hypothetical protein